MTTWSENGIRRSADGLGRLVTLAGDENERPFVGQLEGAADGVAAIELDDGLATRRRDPGGHRLGDDRRVFGARVVRGDDRDIGELTDRKTHGSPLAAIAITTGAEDDDETAVGDSLQRLEDGAETLRGVGVVDKDRGREIGDHRLEPSA